MDTDHKRPRYTFYIFSFSCEAVVLLISLKLDSLNPSCYTHTHLPNGQVIESSHNNYIFLFLQDVHHIWCCLILLWGKYNGKGQDLYQPGMDTLSPPKQLQEINIYQNLGEYQEGK